MARPGLTTIKTLFAHSCNRCAFPGCDHRLTDPLWSGVRADIAHIRGERPAAARYAPEMTDADRNAIDNLMLLCPNHHREIDRLRPQEWSAERLMEVKAAHEADCGGEEWASDPMLEHFSSLLASAEGEADQTAATIEKPRLVIQDGPGDTFIVANTGNVDAFEVAVAESSNTGSGGMLRLETERLARLSPGGQWKAGLYARAFGDRGTPIVRVTWLDADGHSYDADFPL